MRFSDPLYLLLLLPVAVGLWISFRHVHGMMRSRKWVSFTLRGLLMSAIVVALAGPEAHRPNEGICTIFLLDRSDSISDVDRKAGEQFIDEALKSLGSKDEAAVVAFGRSSVIDVAPGNARRLNRILSVVDGSGTNLAGAIRLASASFPDGKARRIVMVSDGNETLGDAVEAATVASGENIQIDHVPLGLKDRAAEVAVLATEVPSDARVGQPIDIRVVVDSTVETDGILTIDRDSVTVKKLGVHLTRGKNAIVATDTMDEPGFHRYRATLLVNQDTDNRNNVGAGFVVVRGKPKVLILQSDPSRSQLASALREQGLQADLYGPEGVPVRPEQLQNYDAVLFNDINAATMTERQMKLVQAAVRDSGVGYAMIGGENSFLPGGYYATPIADVLPVDLNIRQRKTFPSTSILIVADASGSMGMIEDGFPKIRLAAKAAESTVQLMSPIDRVGVAGSTDGIEFVARMQVASDKASIISQIRKLDVGGGGIYVKPSMDFAEEVLNAEPSKVRHFILLADGNDCDDQDGCIEVAQRMRRNRITVSVVSIGDGKDVLFLRGLAAAGGGRFYLAKRAGQLPAIFTQDASVMSRSAIEEGAFLPKVYAGSDILRGIPAMPALYAYCLTDSKPLSHVDMKTGKDDPLLATWQYGLGTSLAFTSDAQPRWARQWIGWDGFGPFWAQATRAISRRATTNQYQVTTRHDGSKAVLDLKAYDSVGNPINSLGAEVRITTPSGESRPINLSQRSPGAYEGSFDAAELGSYVVTVSEDAAGGGKRISTSGFAVPYPPEYKRYRANRPLMERVSRAAGGRELSGPAEAARPVSNPGFSISRLWPSFLLFAAVLLPFDVASRRVAIPLIEGLQRLVLWLRRRKAALRERPVEQLERVDRLRKAKERIPKGPAPGDGGGPISIPRPERRPEIRPTPSGSASSRLLEAKRKRHDSDKDG